MIKNIKTLPFPDWLLVTDYSLILNDDGISEDGEPNKVFKASGKCIFSEKSRRVIDNENKEVNLLGRVIVKGDIAPQLKSVSSGSITINGYTYEIHTGSRPRNPNGTIHHTSFEIK